MTMGMKMYLHGGIGTDMLWFESWAPSSAGATVGVCIGLFIFAIFERYLAAFRRACDEGWRKGVIGFHRPVTSGPYLSPRFTPLGSSGHPLGDRRESTFKPYSAIPEERSTPGTASSTPSVVPVPEYTSACSSDQLEGRAKVAGQVSDCIAPGHAHSHLPRAARRTLDPARESRWSRPFRWGVDMPRGLLQALQTLIHYLLMLVVMTFNIWWIISVIVGSGVGEVMFGRFGSTQVGH